MKVIIAGSRHIKDERLVIDAIKRCPWLHEMTEEVSGCAPGVDTIAANWARGEGYTVKEMPADWDNLKAKGAVIRRNKQTGRWYNAAAGPERNERMAQYADALILIWNGRSPGSQDMLDAARERGLVIWQEKV